MTGANEAELMNELRIPFAMFSIIDNLANGIGEKLTVRCSLCVAEWLRANANARPFVDQLEEFKLAQKANSDRMEAAVLRVLNKLGETQFLSKLA